MACCRTMARVHLSTLTQASECGTCECAECQALPMWHPPAKPLEAFSRKRTNLCTHGCIDVCLSQKPALRVRTLEQQGRLKWPRLALHQMRQAGAGHTQFQDGILARSGPAIAAGVVQRQRPATIPLFPVTCTHGDMHITTETQLESVARTSTRRWHAAASCKGHASWAARAEEMLMQMQRVKQLAHTALRTGTRTCWAAKRLALRIAARISGDCSSSFMAA